MHEADENRGHALNSKIQNSFEGFRLKTPDNLWSAIKLSFPNLDSRNMVDLLQVLKLFKDAASLNPVNSTLIWDYLRAYIWVWRHRSTKVI